MARAHIQHEISNKRQKKKNKKKHEISDRQRILYRAHLQVDDTGMARADVLRRGAVGEVPRHHGARGVGRPDATRGGIDDDAGDVDLDGQRGQIGQRGGKESERTREGQRQKK